ncbi:hypothetical protein [Candidatus Magnetaquicoccus inordinatus]|uniref:hypothetical protein n=1 Tax=Candidatus Magnetaquicoccus inordinatus TaxID=2496818 RepID=UPI00102B573F|nr:hypothetical protein [Candidatus Magnetaquicoccus inordinatus]
MDSITELRLLDTGNEFICLTLAQYCLHEETIAKIFKKAIEDGNYYLKLACLTNKSIGRGDWQFHKLPLALFNGDEEKLLKWFKSITNKELVELFRNETLDDGFLTDFLEADNELWGSLTEEKQRLLLLALSQNSRISKNYEGPMDGYAEYLHDKLFSTIWNLAKKLPVSSSWARSLGLLLENANDCRHEFDSLEVAKRWIVKEDRDKKEEGKKFLSDYGLVRCSIYKDSIKDFHSKDKSNKIHFEHEDIAYRACAYKNLERFTVDDIKYVYKKDNVLAVEQLLKNLNIWRQYKLRDALRDICWDADENFNNYHRDCANTYKWIEEDLSRKHPKWFEVVDEEALVDEDDTVLTSDTTRTLLKESNEELTSAMYQMSDTINKNRYTIKWLFYGIVLIIIILLFN